MDERIVELSRNEAKRSGKRDVINVARKLEANRIEIKLRL